MPRAHTVTQRTRIARALGLGLILALAPLASGGHGPRRAGPVFERGPDRIASGDLHEVRRRHHRGRRAHAGVLWVDGRRYRIGASRPYRDVACAFRRSGYPAHVDRRHGWRRVVVRGCADARWRPGLYDGGFHRHGRRALVVSLAPRQRRCR
jgi:hypothetical protein